MTLFFQKLNINWSLLLSLLMQAGNMGKWERETSLMVMMMMMIWIDRIFGIDRNDRFVVWVVWQKKLHSTQCRPLVTKEGLVEAVPLDRTLHLTLCSKYTTILYCFVCYHMFHEYIHIHTWRKQRKEWIYSLVSPLSNTKQTNCRVLLESFHHFSSISTQI